MVQSATEYPFIASAINITTLLLIHLRISQQYTFCPCCGMDFKKEKKIPVKEMATFAICWRSSRGRPSSTSCFRLELLHCWRIMSR